MSRPTAETPRSDLIDWVESRLPIKCVADGDA
jgi:hypothetical protein